MSGASWLSSPGARLTLPCGHEVQLNAEGNCLVTGVRRWSVGVERLVRHRHWFLACFCSGPASGFGSYPLGRQIP